MHLSIQGFNSQEVIMNCVYELVHVWTHIWLSTLKVQTLVLLVKLSFNSDLKCDNQCCNNTVTHDYPQHCWPQSSQPQTFT